MLSEEEVKKLLFRTQQNRFASFRKGNDALYRMHCKIEKIIRIILEKSPSKNNKKRGRPRG